MWDEAAVVSLIFFYSRQQVAASLLLQHPRTHYYYYTHSHMTRGGILFGMVLVRVDVIGVVCVRDWFSVSQVDLAVVRYG